LEQVISKYCPSGLHAAELTAKPFSKWRILSSDVTLIFGPSDVGFADATFVVNSSTTAVNILFNI
jgi:hypothetical protein